MPYSRRALALRPVNSIKHEITWSDLAIDASAIIVKDIAIGVEPPDKNLATEVAIGSTVRSIYFEFHFSAQTTTNPKVIHWTIGKEPFGTNLGSPSSYNTIDRRFIFKRGMEMLPADKSTVFKRIFVVRIPPRFRRIGDNDKLFLRYISTSAETINACGFAIYKELK